MPVNKALRAGLKQLAFKGCEGSREEEAPLAEEAIPLQRDFLFIGRGQDLHGSGMGELREHAIA